MMEKSKIEISFDNFKEEVELFFMTKFITGNELKKKYSECLDIIYNITKTKDPNRGIIAFNPQYGQGKSFFFEVAQHRHRRKYKSNLFKWTTARELCHIYTSCAKGENPEEKLMEFINVKRLFIDDIGDELKDGKERSHYANKLNVVRFVLLKRYEQWLDPKKRWKTYGTTNLTIQQFGENYDGRVADRILQMCYFMEFKFMSSGSFRQLSETRKLTPLEIQKNHDSFKKKEEIVRVDLEKYFNELVEETDEYFDAKDVSFWTFVKGYLLDKGLLVEDDFQKIDETTLDASELILRRDTRETNRFKLKHTTPAVRSEIMEKALDGIRRKDVFETAKNMIAKRKFMELRNKKHVFK